MHFPQFAQVIQSLELFFLSADYSVTVASKCLPAAHW